MTRFWGRDTDRHTLGMPQKNKVPGTIVNVRKVSLSPKAHSRGTLPELVDSGRYCRVRGRHLSQQNADLRALLLPCGLGAQNAA